MTTRPPYLSMIHPNMGEAIPPWMLRSEYAPAVMARVQPNSVIIGLKNTPKLYTHVPYPSPQMTFVARTIHQP